MPRGTLSYRCVLVLLFLYAVLFKSGNNTVTKVTDNVTKSYVLWNIFLTLYVTIILFIFGNGREGSHESTNDYINMVIVLPLFYYSGKRLFENLDDLMRVVCVVGVIQSIIIIAGMLSSAVNSILLIINSDSAFADRMADMMASGYHLGFKCFTSLGSLQMALSQIAAWYFIEKKASILSFCIFIIISFASALLSRTGLLVSVVCVIFIFLGTNKISKRLMLIGISFVILVVLILDITSVINVSDFIIEHFGRFIFLFENGIYESYFSSFLGHKGVDTNTIPPISGYTIIGTGITKGVTATGIKVLCDGAFLRNYAAMGLIVAVLNYLLIFKYFHRILKKCKDKLNRLLIVLIVIIWIVGEFKEYFTYQIYYMCFIMIILSFVELNEKKQIL